MPAISISFLPRASNSFLPLRHLLPPSSPSFFPSFLPLILFLPLRTLPLLPPMHPRPFASKSSPSFLPLILFPLHLFPPDSLAPHPLPSHPVPAPPPPFPPPLSLHLPPRLSPIEEPAALRSNSRAMGDHSETPNCRRERNGEPLSSNGANTLLHHLRRESIPPSPRPPRLLSRPPACPLPPCVDPRAPRTCHMSSNS